MHNRQISVVGKSYPTTRLTSLFATSPCPWFTFFVVILLVISIKFFASTDFSLDRQSLNFDTLELNVARETAALAESQRIAATASGGGGLPTPRTPNARSAVLWRVILQYTSIEGSDLLTPQYLPTIHLIESALWNIEQWQSLCWTFNETRCPPFSSVLQWFYPGSRINGVWEWSGKGYRLSTVNKTVDLLHSEPDGGWFIDYRAIGPWIGSSVLRTQITIGSRPGAGSEEIAELQRRYTAYLNTFRQVVGALNQQVDKKIALTYGGDGIDEDEINKAVNHDLPYFCFSLLAILVSMYFYTNSLFLAFSFVILLCLALPPGFLISAVLTNHYQINALFLLACYIGSAEGVTFGTAIFSAFTQSGTMATHGRSNNLSLTQRIAWVYRHTVVAVLASTLALVFCFGIVGVIPSNAMYQVSVQLAAIAGSQCFTMCTAWPCAMLFHHKHISGRRRNMQRRKEYLKQIGAVGLSSAHKREPYQRFMADLYDYRVGCQAATTTPQGPLGGAVLNPLLAGHRDSESASPLLLPRLSTAPIVFDRAHERHKCFDTQHGRKQQASSLIHVPQRMCLTVKYGRSQLSRRGEVLKKIDTFLVSRGASALSASSYTACNRIWSSLADAFGIQSGREDGDPGPISRPANAIEVIADILCETVQIPRGDILHPSNIKGSQKNLRSSVTTFPPTPVTPSTSKSRLFGSINAVRSSDDSPLVFTKDAIFPHCAPSSPQEAHVMTALPLQDVVEIIGKPADLDETFRSELQQRLLLQLLMLPETSQGPIPYMRGSTDFGDADLNQEISPELLKEIVRTNGEVAKRMAIRRPLLYEGQTSLWQKVVNKYRIQWWNSSFRRWILKMRKKPETHLEKAYRIMSAPVRPPEYSRAEKFMGGPFGEFVMRPVPSLITIGVILAATAILAGLGFSVMRLSPTSTHLYPEGTRTSRFLAIQAYFPRGPAACDACGPFWRDQSLYQSLTGCDGSLYSEIDACGVCNGVNECRGCDGLGNKVDQCGVCGGSGLSCLGCDGVLFSAAVNDSCGVCRPSPAEAAQAECNTSTECSSRGFLVSSPGGGQACKCIGRWAGPVCADCVGCGSGECSPKGQCLCKGFLIGPNCQDCSPNCIHGSCNKDGLCVCRGFWRGPSCDTCGCAPGLTCDDFGVCLGCDGSNSTKVYDECDVCGGTNKCKGCDGGSGVLDDCGVCNGENLCRQTCVRMQPPGTYSFPVEFIWGAYSTSATRRTQDGTPQLTIDPRFNLARNDAQVMVVKVCAGLACTTESALSSHCVFLDYFYWLKNQSMSFPQGPNVTKSLYEFVQRTDRHSEVKFTLNSQGEPQRVDWLHSSVQVIVNSDRQSTKITEMHSFWKRWSRNAEASLGFTIAVGCEECVRSVSVTVVGVTALELSFLSLVFCIGTALLLSSSLRQGLVAFISVFTLAVFEVGVWFLIGDFGYVESILLCSLLGMSILYILIMLDGYQEHLHLSGSHWLGFATTRDRAGKMMLLRSGTVVIVSAVTSALAAIFLLGCKVPAFFQFGKLLILINIGNIIWCCFFVPSLCAWLGPRSAFVGKVKRLLLYLLATFLAYLIPLVLAIMISYGVIGFF